MGVSFLKTQKSCRNYVLIVVHGFDSWSVDAGCLPFKTSERL